MALTSYLDKGASLGRDAACLTVGDSSLSYGEVQDLSRSTARALWRSGIGPGDTVGILSANDPIAFACVFAIARAGAVWCPINPRSVATENRDLLDLFGCSALIFQGDFAAMVAEVRGDLPQLHTLVCLDSDVPGATTFREWLDGGGAASTGADPAVEGSTGGDLVALVGTGGTTGRPKGVMLTDRNIETMTALTLMSYPFDDRPVYLALAPLTHAAGVLCFPVMACGGEIVILPKPDVGAFLHAIERHRVTHTFLTPTVIYRVLEHEALDRTDLTSLRCFWYGAAQMSPTRLEQALIRIGPVMAQLFGQSEAPMMISTMAPHEHVDADGVPIRSRLSSAGRPTPLVTLAVVDEHGTPLGAGERGEIVVRGSLVMAGYYRDPEGTAEVSRGGWHHTGDIGYLDDDGYLFIVDRAKDMVITGGFNVYSAEVEQAVLAHDAVADCAVVGLPDDDWGERVVAVVQLRADATATAAAIRSFVKDRVGGIKAPKQVEFWPDLPRSTVGKILKADVRERLVRGGGTVDPVVVLATDTST